MKKEKKSNKHVDPSEEGGGAEGGGGAAGTASSTTGSSLTQQYGDFGASVLKNFESQAYCRFAQPAPESARNIFSQWGGQVPREFPSHRDDVSFFGGGGSSRTFDAIIQEEEEEESTRNSESQGGGDAKSATKLVMIDVADHRSDREERLNIPPSIISRDQASDDVAIQRLDGNVPLDSIPLSDFYNMILETPFNKRETMLKKEQQRRSGDAELFLDGHPVDVPIQYKSMLDRIYARLDQIVGNKDQALELVSVKVQPAGRRTIWVNFQEMCKALSRTPEEVRSYICNELTTTSKYDGEGRIHIDITRLTQDKLQKLVSDYAMTHVYCQSCRGFQTDLVRDTALRLDQVVCRNCGSKRSVDSTAGGFVAVANRRARKRLRALA